MRFRPRLAAPKSLRDGSRETFLQGFSNVMSATEDSSVGTGILPVPVRDRQDACPTNLRY